MVIIVVLKKTPLGIFLYLNRIMKNKTIILLLLLCLDLMSI